MDVPESGDDVFEDPLDDGEELVCELLPQYWLPLEDAPVTSRFIPMALSSFSLFCNLQWPSSLSFSLSLLICSRLRDVDIVECSSLSTLFLQDKGCLAFGVDVVRTSEYKQDELVGIMEELISDVGIGGVRLVFSSDSDLYMGGLKFTTFGFSDRIFCCSLVITEDFFRSKIDAVIDKDELIGGEVVMVLDGIDMDGNCVGDGKLVHKICSISPIALEIITKSSV